jgi:hypothetical protein
MTTVFRALGNKPPNPVLAIVVRSAYKTAEYYRGQAAELRALAARQPEGSVIREQLLKLATEYEEMAVRAERS